jgi:hypothetical protein
MLSRPPGSAVRRLTRTILLLTMIMFAAACSSNPSAPAPDHPASGSTASAVGYSACLRSHGVRAFPDPGSGGQVPKTSARQLGVSDQQLEAAQSACRQLYPTQGGRGHGAADGSFRECEETGDCPQPLVEQAMTQLRRFARCMRSHRLPRFPDPVVDSEGRPEFYIRPWKDGIDPDSARFANTEQACSSVMRPFFTPPLAIYLRGNN